jgi:hypothetical protein
MNNSFYLFMVTIGLVASKTICAQYVDPDSAYVGRKNAIMILANPLLQVALSSDSRAALFGLSYKRVLHNNKRLKLGAGYEFIDLSPYENEIPLARIPEATDSAIVINSKKQFYNRTHIRGGLEWSEFSSKHGMVYGLDVQVGFRKDHNESYNAQHLVAPRDSTILNPNYFSSSPNSKEGVYDFDHYYMDIGLVANIGYRVQLKEKWEINLSFSPEFNLYFVTNSKWNLDTPEPLQYLPSNGFEMQLRLLLVDIGYRF